MVSSFSLSHTLCLSLSLFPSLSISLAFSFTPSLSVSLSLSFYILYIYLSLYFLQWLSVKTVQKIRHSTAMDRNRFTNKLQNLFGWRYIVYRSRFPTDSERLQAPAAHLSRVASSDRLSERLQAGQVSEHWRAGSQVRFNQTLNFFQEQKKVN